MSYEGYSPGPPESPGQAAPRPHVDERTLRVEKLQVERKFFQFVLKENARGRFLRITEDVSGRRDAIIVPATGLADFARVLDEIAAGLDDGDGPVDPPDA